MNGNKFKKNSFFIVRLENTTKIIMSSKNSKIKKIKSSKNSKIKKIKSSKNSKTSKVRRIQKLQKFEEFKKKQCTLFYIIVLLFNIYSHIPS